MGFRGRLFPREIPPAARQARGSVVEVAAPVTAPLHLQQVDVLARNESSPQSDGLGAQGLTDLRAAISLVIGGAATSVLLCGFADGRAQLRLAHELAAEGVVIEPMVRPGGGGFDIRVRRVPALDT